MLLFLQIAFITTSTPEHILITLLSAMTLNPFDSRAPTEMRYIFKSGTYRTSINVLLNPSWFLNWIEPTPYVVRGLLFAV